MTVALVGSQKMFAMAAPCTLMNTSAPMHILACSAGPGRVTVMSRARERGRAKCYKYDTRARADELLRSQPPSYPLQTPFLPISDPL
eukprot:680820-Prorocentrum_minimum.AAC.1